MAFGIGEYAFPACFGMDGADGVDDVFRLDAISSHILNRRGTDGAGYGSEVFSSMPMVGDTMVDKSVPLLASGGLNQ